MFLQRFPLHGWLGLALIAVAWPLNWLLEGARTHFLFFPLWLGYCLAIDALTLQRTGASLLARDWRKYIGLFLASIPVWWLFEAFNWRVQNWRYDGRELFTDLEFGFWASLSFSTVVPAVFASAELAASFGFLRRLQGGRALRLGPRHLRIAFTAGWVMLALMLAWPRYFFPFLWLSLYFITEPLNVWFGYYNLPRRAEQGGWRPLLALWCGVLLTAFFWEFWNFWAYPKWIYAVPWANFWHVFEMPLLGYLGYLPFALELHALYHLIVGLLGRKETDYIRL